MKNVTTELRAFAEKGTRINCSQRSIILIRVTALPSFVTDEEERATNRYLTMTTIATFFSSVTATTLQFTYSQAGTTLGNTVNFFWFLSIVFSVASGINSLLGLTWRKSSM